MVYYEKERYDEILAKLDGPGISVRTAPLKGQRGLVKAWGSLNRGSGNRGFRMTWRMFDRHANTLAK